MCTYFKAETEDYSLREKIRGYEVSFWKSRSFVYAELNESVEATNSSYSATGEFLRYIYSELVAKNHENIQSRCLVHEFSFTDIFLNSTLYGCGFLMLLWKSAQTIGPAIISYLLKYFYSFSAAELNNIESENDVFAQEFSCEESDYGDSDDEDIEQLYIWQVK